MNPKIVNKKEITGIIKDVLPLLDVVTGLELKQPTVVIGGRSVSYGVTTTDAFYNERDRKIHIVKSIISAKYYNLMRLKAMLAHEMFHYAMHRKGVVHRRDQMHRNADALTRASKEVSQLLPGRGLAKLEKSGLFRRFAGLAFKNVLLRMFDEAGAYAFEALYMSQKTERTPFDCLCFGSRYYGSIIRLYQKRIVSFAANPRSNILPDFVRFLLLMNVEGQVKGEFVDKILESIQTDLGRAIALIVLDASRGRQKEAIGEMVAAQDKGLAASMRFFKRLLGAHSR